MSRSSVNKVIIIGNLGADPETRYTAGGTAVTNINVATSDSWRDKQSGEMQERTEWHRVVFFARLAEVAGEYLRKGAKVYIEGRLQTRKWQGQDGQDRYTTEIVGNEMQMLDSRPASDSPFGGNRSSKPTAPAAPAPGTQAGDYRAASQGGQSPQSTPAQAPLLDDDPSDDVPF